MSAWTENGMDDRLRGAPAAVHLNNPDGHQFGRPYVSSYQLAIALDEADPDLLGALGKELGGVGCGTSRITHRGAGKPVVAVD